MYNKQTRITGGKLASYFDSQVIEQNAQEVTFFSGAASTNESLANYVGNPLPFNEQQVILAMGFMPSHMVIPDDANVDVPTLLAALRGATVEMTVERNRVLQLPLTRMMDLEVDLEGEDVVTAGAIVAASSYTTWCIKSPEIFKLTEPIIIPPNASFDVKLFFDTSITSSLPTEAQWTTAIGSGFKLRCEMQAARKASAAELATLT